MQKLTIAAGVGTDYTLYEGHFGESPFYLIYEVTAADGYTWKETLKNPGFKEEMHGDPKKAKSVAALLKNIDVLLAHQVGPNVKRMQQQFVVLIAQNRSLQQNLNWAVTNYPTLSAALNGEGKRIMKI